MAEINWGIVNDAPNVFAMGLQGYQAGQQAVAQRQRQALIQREADREEAQYQAGLKRQQRRSEITASYAGDPTKARQDAIGSGDFELAEQFSKLDAGRREEIGRKAEIGAKVAQQLLGQFPDDGMLEQRKAAALAMAPQLAQYGVTPEEVAASDYSTGGLQRSLALGMSVNEAIVKANADRDFRARDEDTKADNARLDQQFDWQKGQDQIRNRNDATRLGFEGQRVGMDRQRLGFEGQRLVLERDKAKREAGAPKLTEGQAKDGFNASRMRGAAQVISKLERDKSFNATLSGAGAAAGGSKSRQYESAKLEWADSLLRSTSGAQATKEEIENTARTYFPQFGDSPDVVRQKTARRREVQTDLARRAGPGAPPSTGAADPLGIR